MSADHLRQDFRHAVRSLLRSPMYALVTVVTLGLGIGANTAIFSVVNGVILRPLPYPKPEQLTFLTTQFPAFGFDQFWVSPPEYFEFQELNKSFSAVGAFTTGEANLSASDRPRRVRTANVDDHLLKALGIQPAAGRLFRGNETVVVGPPPAPGAPPLPLPPYTILSYELWQAAFGGRDMIGQTVEVNGLSREVIGIMPPGADVMDNRTELWFPLGLNRGVRTNRGSHFLYLIGRLKDGVTPQQAQSELASLLGSWGERVGVKGHVFKSLAPGVDPKTNPGAGHILQMEPMQEELIGSASRAIWVLQAAVGFVLLIACANLANLLLARAETRRREFAVRTALGAGRWHLVRQFMTEGLMLSFAGGALGLVVARFGVQALIRLYPTTLPRTSELSIDPIVLLFTIAVSIATGLLFGLAPLMHARASGMLSALKEGGAKGATGGVRGRIRSALVTVEVALAVMLVIGASLLLRTVWNLTQIDAGFDRSRLVTFTMALPQARYPQPPARAQLYQRLLGQLRAIPGVQGATAMSGLPPNRPLNANDTEIGNYTAPPEGPYENVDYYQNVMTGYFETMGIPIVQGRSFQASDATSTGLVAVVNETLVNTFWKNLNPIGQQLRPCCGDQRPWFTVVGVAKDVKQGGVDQKTGTEMYFLIDQTANQAQFAAAPGTLNIVLRSTLPAGALRSAIEHAVRQADASVPIARLQDMNGVFDESIRRPRLLAHLLGGFAGIALLLAAIGTYGILSYMVAERRREIGIRMALGADRGRVLAHVLKQGLVLTAIGIAAGLAGAFALNRLIASLLFGVRPTDPTTLTLVVMTIVAVAIAACWVPAWRASRLDPNVVLRID